MRSTYNVRWVYSQNNDMLDKKVFVRVVLTIGYLLILQYFKNTENDLYDTENGAFRLCH